MDSLLSLSFTLGMSGQSITEALISDKGSVGNRMRKHAQVPPFPAFLRSSVSLPRYSTGENRRDGGLGRAEPPPFVVIVVVGDSFITPYGGKPSSKFTGFVLSVPGAWIGDDTGEALSVLVTTAGN